MCLSKVAPASFFLILGMILSGCVQKSGEEGYETTPTPVSVIKTPGPDPFSGPPELQACLREKLGGTAYEDLSMHRRMAKPEESAMINSCIEQFRSQKVQSENRMIPAPEMNETWRPSGMVIQGRYADAEVIGVGQGTYRMYFGEEPEVADEPHVLSAVSHDGISWKKEDGVRMENAVFPDVVRLPDGSFRMYFQRNGVIMSAVSKDGLDWKLEPGIRVDRGGHYSLDDRGIGASTTIRLDDGSYLMVYRTEHDQKYCTHSPNPFSTFLFYAVSKDGINFKKKGMAIDSRNDEFCDLVDGPELVMWDDGKIHLFFWSHRGIYESVYDSGNFSEPELILNRFPGDEPPADPTLIKIKDEWFMYYGQHGKGIFYAVLKR